MSQYNTLHFVAAQLEDGWMLQSEHVTKLQTVIGSWIAKSWRNYQNCCKLCSARVKETLTQL